MTTTIARFPGSRQEHLIREGKITLCGRDATAAAKYQHSDCGADRKVRPLCPTCRARQELCLGCLHRSMAQIEHTCDFDLYNE